MGHRYAMNFVDSVPDDSIVVESEGIRIVLKKETVPFFNGASVDFLADQGGFKFSNSNELSLLPEHRRMTRELEAKKSER